MRLRRLLILVLIGPALLTSGCVRGCTSTRPPIHLNPNMDVQPKYRPQAESSFFYDGGAMRVPVPDTVARGEFHESEAFETGMTEEGDFLTSLPPEMNGGDPDRGRQRFEIYCAPCHGETGDGQGILFERGVPVTSLFDERIMGLTAGELFLVISNGKGLMPAYRYPVPAHDRWNIIVHVQSLQNDYREAQSSK